jgi:hypothetical protein
MADANHTQSPGCVVKQIKVGEQYYPPLKQQNRSRVVPFLRLRGHWLQQLGFEQHSQVNITATQGELVIKLVPQGAGHD